MIIVFLGEGAYLLYLLDKFVWLIHVHYNKALPDEIREEHDITFKNGCKSNDKCTKDSEADVNKTTKYIDRYLVDGKSPELIPFPFLRKSRRPLSCSKKFHWLFIVIFFQIVAFGFVIYVSWKLLHFILIIIIEQTSDPNNEYNNLLAILPTVAINGWLLLKKGVFKHALKEVIGKAVKSTIEHEKH